MIITQLLLGKGAQDGVHPEVTSESCNEKRSLSKGKNTFLCGILKATKANNITENLSFCVFGILGEDGNLRLS